VSGPEILKNFFSGNSLSSTAPVNQMKKATLAAMSIRTLYTSHANGLVKALQSIEAVSELELKKSLLLYKDYIINTTVLYVCIYLLFCCCWKFI
jgi:hypothetical protein